MAHEHGHDRQLARHRAASLAGQEPRRLVAAGDPRLQVGPRTSRPARAVPNGSSERKGRHRTARTGFRHFSLRSPERRKGRSAR